VGKIKTSQKNEGKTSKKVIAHKNTSGYLAGFAML